MFNIITSTIGTMVLLWFATGIIMLAFFVNIAVAKNTPISTKLLAVLVASFHLPYMLIIMGGLPGGIIISETATDDICQCENCKRRRAAQGGGE